MWSLRLQRLTTRRFARRPSLYFPLKIQCSFLTSAQTAEVLRPFIFAVHPDFFGQYPKEQAINEHSLKQLYAHLDNIREPSSHVKPKDLKFYLRNKQREDKGHPIFQPVTVSLLTRDVYSTISNILKTCSLPTHNLKEISSKAPPPFPRPVHWHHSYYAYTGKKNPNAEAPVRQHRVHNSLRHWLKTNLPIAKRNHASSLPIRQETERLRVSLKEELCLTELKWISRWDVGAFRACLKSLDKMLQQHTDIMGNLRGKALVFGGSTCVNREGQVMLSIKDVEHQWLSFLCSLPTHMKILDQLAPAERDLSDLLGGGMRLSRHCVRYLMPAHTYLGFLRKTSSGIERYRQTLKGERDYQRIGRGTLADVEINIVSDSGRMHVSPSGTLHITASTQAPDLINFLLDNGFRAKDIRRNHQRHLMEEISISQACVEELGLTALTKDDTVTAEEMVSCCKRLCENAANFGVSLHNASLRVSHIYMVLRGGELCIPWNWKL